jgi:hypothetical protein
MLPGGTDPLYRAMLAGAHRPTARIEIWRQGVRIDNYGAAGVPFIDGQLSATLTSQVSRNLNFSVNEDLWPGEDIGALLAPWGNEARVWMGVKPGAGTPFEWQVFRGRINQPVLTETAVTVPCVDRGGDVNDSGFIGPENSQVGNIIATEFRRVINDGVEDATFGTFDVPAQRTPALEWEWDRGSAADDLATAVGGYWYALANGDYVLRRIPWTVEQVPILTLSDGDGGTLYSAIPELSRNEVFNIVTVVGERGDGTLPVYATVQDNDITSPTWVGGAFGRKSKLIRAQAVVNQGQALSLGNAALSQSRSLRATWQVSMTCDPSMELGDAFWIEARNQPPSAQVLASFSMPISGDGAMTAAFRALPPHLVGVAS